MPITLPPVSAGQEILQSQFARDDGATVQTTLGPIQFLEPDGRIVNADAETNPSSAEIPVTGVDGGDFGTDAPVRSITDTQATDNTVGIGSDPTNGIEVDSGRMLKRVQPAPQGRAHRVRKRSNHVTLFIDKIAN